MNDYSEYLSAHLPGALATGEGQIDIVEVRAGSDSDFGKIKDGILRRLDDLQVPYLLTIKSAHRTPERMLESAKEFPGVAENTRLRVVACIAAAGGSAHIAGMTASETQTPVIAYPVPSSAGGQTDSGPSMVNMPPGMPNGFQPVPEHAAQMAATIRNMEIEPGYNGISFDPAIAGSVDAGLLEELGVEIDDESPIGILPQDLDVKKPTIEDWCVQLPIIVPITKKQLTPGTAYKYGRLNQNGLYMGVQVAGNANLKNATLFGAQILGNTNPAIRENLVSYRRSLHDSVVAKDEDLLKQQLGG